MSDGPVPGGLDGDGSGGLDGDGSGGLGSRSGGEVTVDALIALLGLAPLSHEGGHYRRMLHDGHSSAIYFLLGTDDASALHRLPGTEVWHHYAGAAVRLLALAPDGTATEHRLGDDLLAGDRPQVVIPGGVWQGAISTDDWSLVGTTMAPPYEQEGFELGDPAALAATHPDAAALIVELGRRSAHLLEGAAGHHDRPPEEREAP